MGATRGVFVTGTDTGVGKTVVACALLRGLRARGLDAGAMKPIETGVEDGEPLDARALQRAAGGCDALDDVCPQRFALPAAPVVAAEAAGQRVDLDAVRRAYRRLSARHAWMVVEGAGGLLVPAAPGVSMADLARDLGLPLLVVARGRLGTLNHTLLTLEAVRARRLRLAGVVICHAEGVPSAADDANLAALRQELGACVMGELPHCGDRSGSPEGDSTHDDALDLDALIEAVNGAS